MSLPTDRVRGGRYFLSFHAPISISMRSPGRLKLGEMETQNFLLLMVTVHGKRENCKVVLSRHLNAGML